MGKVKLTFSFIVFAQFWLSCVVPARRGFKSVASSQIIGSDQLDEDDILSGLAHHPPRGWFLRQSAAYRPSSLEVDRSRIRTHYHKHGYFSAEVSKPLIRFESDGVYIEYAVDEGMRFLCSSVELSEDSRSVGEANLAALREKLTLRSGLPFDYENYARDKQMLLRSLHTQAFYDAAVEGEVRVNRSAGRVEVKYNLSPGQKKFFGPISVVTASIPESAVRSRIAWSKGDPYRPGAVDTTRGRLSELELLSSARVEFKSHPDSQELASGIEIHEALQDEVAFGAGILVDTANTVLRGRATYLKRHFFHPLRSLRISLLPAYFVEAGRPGFQGSASVRQDDLFSWPRVRGRARLALSVEQYRGFTSLPGQFQLGLERPFLEDHLKVTAETFVAAQNVQINDEILEDSPLARRAGLFNSQYVGMQSTAILDRRDDPLSPHRGYLIGAHVQWGRLLNASKNRFVVVGGQISGFTPVTSSRLVAAARLKASANVADSPLPPGLRVFGGGSGGHRGFARRELSPGLLGEDSDYVAVGGEAEVLGSAELRFDIAQVYGSWLGVAVFCDAGDVALSSSAIELDRPHTAAGLGVRLGTPIGPIRFDTAIRLNRMGDTEAAPGERWALHLAIGEAF